MRIEGASEFFSRISAMPRQKQAAEGSVFENNAAINPYVIKTEIDILDISEIGKRLRFNAEDAEKLNDVKAAAGGDKILELMGDSLIGVEKVFEQMQNLAVLAQNTTLTVTDRLTLQMEMEKLKESLDYAANSMSDKFAMMSGQKVKMFKREQSSFVPGAYAPEDAGGRNLLERAMDRAVNGEDWNAAEAYQSFEELKQVYVYDRNDFTPGHETMIIQVEEGEWFTLPPEVDLENSIIECFGESVRSEWYTATERERIENNIPTLRDRLEASNTPVLMDAKSAAEGAERLERQLNEIKKLRESFVNFAKNNNQTSGDSKKMSEGEIDAMLGEIAQAEETETEADSNTFRTELGIMEYTGVEKNSRPRLVDPKGPKGEMFYRLQQFFDETAAKFAGAVSETINDVKHTWTNFGFKSWFTKLEEPRPSYDLDLGSNFTVLPMSIQSGKLYGGI